MELALSSLGDLAEPPSSACHGAEQKQPSDWSRTEELGVSAHSHDAEQGTCEDQALERGVLVPTCQASREPTTRDRPNDVGVGAIAQ